jgi:hypothetical protein
VETISSASSDQLRGSPLTAVFSSESSLTDLFELAAATKETDEEEGRGRRAEDRISSNEHGEKSPLPRKKDNKGEEETEEALSLS